MSIPASWYPDPQDATRVRWWDGLGWTDVTQPDPTGTSTAGSEPAPVSLPAFREQLAVQPVGNERQQEPSMFGVPVTQTLFGVPLDEQPLGQSAPPPAHSAGATAEADPYLWPGYVPMGGPDGGRAARSTPLIDLRKFSANTAAIWFIVFLPWIHVALVVVALQMITSIVAPGTFGDSTQAQIGNVLAFVAVDLLVFAAVQILLAGSDSRILRSRGFAAPNAWWMLVPVVFMILRTVKTGARGVVHLVMWAIVLIAPILLGFVFQAIVLHFATGLAR